MKQNLIELDVGGCGARRLDEQPAAEAGRERVDRAIAERVNRVMWTEPPITSTRYEPQGIAKKKL